MTLIKTIYRDRSQAFTQTIAYFLTFVSLGAIAAVWGPTLPGLAEHTTSPLSQVSILLSAYPLGRLLGFLIGGHLYDRTAGHLVMGIALLFASALLAIVPLVPWLAALVIVLLLLGTCVGALDVGGNTLLMWVHGQRVGPFMNGLHFCFGVGALIAPAIIAQLIQVSGDIVWGYWALALLALPAAAMLLSQASPSPQKVQDDGAPAAIDPLLVFLIASFFFFFIGAEFSFGSWIFSYVVHLNLGSEATAAVLNSLYWGAIALGRLLAALASVRVGPAAILRTALVGCLLSMALILLWPASHLVIWISTFGIGLAMGPLFPCILAFAGKRMAITGRVTSLFFIGVSLGAMSLPWFIGQVFESIGPTTTMFTVAGAMVMATVVFALLTRLKPVSLFKPQMDTDTHG